MGERPLDVSLLNLFIGILAHHLDVSSQRKSTERIFGLAFFLHPKFRAETDGKREHADARQFGKQKVTELMNNNQHSEADDRRNNRVNYVLHPFSPSPAVTSMNKRRSGLPSPSI